MVAAIQFNPVEPMEALFVTMSTIGNTAFFGFIVTASNSDNSNISIPVFMMIYLECMNHFN